VDGGLSKELGLNPRHSLQLKIELVMEIYGVSRVEAWQDNSE